MTDHFNEKAQAILRDSEGNGGLTIRSLFDLVVAGHNDSIEASAKIAAKLDAHVSEARERDDRLDDVEGWIREWEPGCALRHSTHLIELGVHRDSDPEGSDYTDKRGALVAVPQTFTREQIVTAVILFLIAVIASNLIGFLVDRWLGGSV